MKSLNVEQHKAILDWMENRINRPFRESFAAAFPAVAEEAKADDVEADLKLNVSYDISVINRLKECTDIKQVREVLDSLTEADIHVKEEKVSYTDKDAEAQLGEGPAGNVNPQV
jgi:hypothetical protein